VLLPSTKVQYREVRCTKVLSKVRKYREVRYVVRKYNYCTVRVQNNNLIFSKVLKVVTKVSTTNNVVYTIVQRCTRTVLIKYEGTFESTFRKYFRKEIPSPKVFLYVRKYFRSKESELFYSSSTFVRKYFRKYERSKVLKVRKYFRPCFRKYDTSVFRT
jgi:hypothetical protein